jgi:hypothetical protein
MNSENIELLDYQYPNMLDKDVVQFCLKIKGTDKPWSHESLGDTK